MDIPYETCDRLKQAGFPQSPNFMTATYYMNEDAYSFIYLREGDDIPRGAVKIPSASELIEHIMLFVNPRARFCIDTTNNEKDEWFAEIRVDGFLDHRGEGTNAAEACADLWLNIQNNGKKE